MGVTLAKRSGMNQFDVARKLIISDSLEGAIERATRLPQRRVAEASDTLFDTPGTFVRLWKLIMQRSFPLRYGPYAELEADATRLHVWETRCVPGLLQTEDYARAVIKAAGPLEADNVIDEDVVARMARQEILAKRDAPLAWFVIDESVLYRSFGGKNVIHEQVEKLLIMAECPKVIVQIMPYTITDHPGVAGPLIIFEFNDSQPIGYAEGRGSGRLIESAADVADAMACYDLIRAAALPRSATLELLKARLTNE
jgi:Domain of unknown function (DUF5753)